MFNRILVVILTGAPTCAIRGIKTHVPTFPTVKPCGIKKIAKQHLIKMRYLLPTGRTGHMGSAWEQGTRAPGCTEAPRNGKNEEKRETMRTKIF